MGHRDRTRGGWAWEEERLVRSTPNCCCDGTAQATVEMVELRMGAPFLATGLQNLEKIKYRNVPNGRGVNQTLTNNGPPLIRSDANAKRPGFQFNLRTGTHPGVRRARTEQSRAKGKHMVFQDVKYDQCPVCDGIVTLALIVPHANRSGLEVHTFKCKKCGSIKSRVVEIAPIEMLPQVAA